MFIITSHYNTITVHASFLSYYFVQLARAWQRKLYNLVRKEEHRVEMYACLWMIIAEQDKHKFQELQELFVDYWKAMETQFVAYCQKE